MQPMYNPMLDPHRRPMMIPRPGIPMMPMGRGGFPPGGHGPPDMYYPYMEDAAMGYYGARPPFGGIPVGPFRQFPHPYDEAFEDYEEELRAFTRKRKRERELEKKDKRKGDDSSKSSGSESDSSSSKKKKKVKDKGKKQGASEKSKAKDEDSESEGEKEGQRLKATQKSRELREKRKSKKKAKSDGEASSEEDGDVEGKKATGKKSSESKEGKETDENLSMQAEADDKKVHVDRVENKKPTQSTPGGEDTTEAEQVAEEKVEMAHNTRTVEEEKMSPSLDVAEPMECSVVKPVAAAVDEEANVNRKVESDLSSGEDFRDDVTEEDSTKGHKIKSSEQVKPQTEKESPLITPDTVSEEKHVKDNASVKVKKAKAKALSGEDSDAKASDSESKKVKQLPLRYQLNEEDEDKSHSRDHHRQKTAPQPASPPLGQRHKHRRSPSPPDYRWHRGARPYSPGVHHRHRQYSRSPPSGGAALSPRKPQSPSYGSPPPSRARSPAHRSRDYSSRHRYDSPSRGKGASGHSPHRRHYSPSPSRTHSPATRPHVRHRSRSSSLSKRSPAYHKKETTPEVAPSPSAVRELKKQNKHLPSSRSPSPKAKQHRDLPKEEPKEPPPPKRPQAEESRPKSPALSPPLSQKDDGRRMSAGRGSALGASSGQLVPPVSEPQLPQPPLPPLPPPLPQQQQQQQPAGKKLPLPTGKQLPNQLPPASVPSTLTTTASTISTTTAERPNPPLPQQQSSTPQQQTDNLLNLLRRYPVMWQGHLALKNDAAAVQLHFLSGNVNLAKVSLPQVIDQRTPALRIVQRMRLEPSQLEGVERRIQVCYSVCGDRMGCVQPLYSGDYSVQNEDDHCLMLALPCGRDAGDVRNQTHILKTSLISYLLQKQAAGIINVQSPQQLQGSQVCSVAVCVCVWWGCYIKQEVKNYLQQ